MKCVICKNGDTRPGKATVFLQRNDAFVIIKEVPADICDNCGEYYLDEDSTAWTLQYAEQAIAKGTEIGIVKYAA